MCLVNRWDSNSSKIRHNKEEENRQTPDPKKLLRHKSSDLRRHGLHVVLPPKLQGYPQKLGICVLAS